MELSNSTKHAQKTPQNYHDPLITFFHCPVRDLDCHSSYCSPKAVILLLQIPHSPRDMAKRRMDCLKSPPPKARKEETLFPCKVATADKHATVSGLLSSLSPIKPPRHFVDKLTDGQTIMRVVGFDKAKLEQLKPFCNYSLPVTLRDYVVQNNKYTNQL